MEFLYILGLIPAIAVYFGARAHYVTLRRRFRLPASVMNAHFLPFLVGGGTVAVVAWFFIVAILAQATDPARIILLLLAPVAFAAGEGLGLLGWSRAMHAHTMPKQISRMA